MAASRKAAAVQPPGKSFKRKTSKSPSTVTPSRLGSIARSHRLPRLPMLVFFQRWRLGARRPVIPRHLVPAPGECRWIRRAVVWNIGWRPKTSFPLHSMIAIAATKLGVRQRHQTECRFPAPLAVGRRQRGLPISLAVVAHLARDAGAPLIRVSAPDLARLDSHFGLPSHQAQGRWRMRSLAKRDLVFAITYLSDPAATGEWRASPLLAENFSALLRLMLVYGSGMIPLADEGPCLRR